MLGNRNTTSGASHRQGTIHARPGNIVTALQFTTAGALHGHGQIRAGVKSHQGRIHTKALSARGAENFMQAGKAESSRWQHCFDGRVCGY
jgi:hypothetical protein